MKDDKRVTNVAVTETEDGLVIGAAPEDIKKEARLARVDELNKKDELTLAERVERLEILQGLT